MPKKTPPEPSQGEQLLKQTVADMNGTMILRVLSGEGKTLLDYAGIHFWAVFLDGPVLRHFHAHLGARVGPKTEPALRALIERLPTALPAPIEAYAGLTGSPTKTVAVAVLAVSKGGRWTTALFRHPKLTAEAAGAAVRLTKRMDEEGPHAALEAALSAAAEPPKPGLNLEELKRVFENAHDVNPEYAVGLNGITEFLDRSLEHETLRSDLTASGRNETHATIIVRGLVGDKDVLMRWGDGPDQAARARPGPSPRTSARSLPVPRRRARR